MTNQENLKAVAVAIGWTELLVLSPTCVMGRSPGGTFLKIPGYYEDLPLAMRDLWPWLEEEVHSQLQLRMILQEDKKRYIVAGDFRPQDAKGNFSQAKGVSPADAICNAVLAVSEHLPKRQEFPHAS